MTNEMYLYISYFAVIFSGLVLAIATILILNKAHQQATSNKKAKKLSSLLRRVFPSWLILAVVLAFISVSYIDCSHSDYAQIVADRDHLINKTQQQVSNMLIWLAVGLFLWGLILIGFLMTASKLNDVQAASNFRSQKHNAENGLNIRSPAESF